jgi:hypothetical protein
LSWQNGCGRGRAKLEDNSGKDARNFADILVQANASSSLAEWLQPELL